MKEIKDGKEYYALLSTK